MKISLFLSLLFVTGTVLLICFFWGCGDSSSTKKQIRPNQAEISDLRLRVSAQDKELVALRNKKGRTHQPFTQPIAAPTTSNRSQNIEQPLASARPNSFPALIAPDSNSAPAQVGTRTDDLNVIVQHCVHHLNKTVSCDVVVESKADHPEELAFKEGGMATDNQGHAVRLPLNWITSDFGWNVILRKGVPVKFVFQFKDESFGASTQANITFHVRWNGVYGDIDMPASVRIS